MAKLKYYNGQEWEQLAPNMEEYNTTKGMIGTLANLLTTAKNNLVVAINEIFGWVEDVETDLDTHKADMATQLELKANKAMGDSFELTLENGWTGTVECSKNDIGQVWIRGNLKPPSTISGIQNIATIPEGYRPPVSCAGLLYCSDNGMSYRSVYVISSTGRLRFVDQDSITTSHNFYLNLLYQV